MNVQQPSVAARILAVIETAVAPINTSAIYDLVEEAENITLVSVTCRDLMAAHKVDRVSLNGRWHYIPLQRDLLGPSPDAAAAEELQRVMDTPSPPVRREAARRSCGRRADNADKALKLRTLDRLIEIVADGIADVLRDVRKDVENAA